MKNTSFVGPIGTIYLRLIACLSLGCLLLLFGASRPASSIAQPAADPTVWSLVWSDEFNGTDGAPIDLTKWTAEIGGNGWGNQELEYYTSRIDNAFQSGGSLVIKAIK